MVWYYCNWFFFVVSVALMWHIILETLNASEQVLLDICGERTEIYLYVIFKYSFAAKQLTNYSTTYSIAVRDLRFPPRLKIQVEVFWVPTPCSVVIGCQRTISLFTIIYVRAVIAKSAATGYVLDDRGSRVRFPAGLGIFIFTTASRTALGPAQPPIQCVPGAPSLGQSGRDVKLTTHLLLVPRSKNAWSYTSTPPIRLPGVVVSQAQGQLYLYLYYYICIFNYCHLHGLGHLVPVPAPVVKYFEIVLCVIVVRFWLN
jgi:hypothetical protein